MASQTVSRQGSRSYSTKRAIPKLRREARKTSNVENADLRTVNKEMRSYRKDLLSIRAQDPREILAIHSMKEEIDPAFKMFRRQYMRKDPVFAPKLDIIHEDKETCSFSSSRELPPLLPREPEASGPGSGSHHPPQSGSERSINDVSGYNLQPATPRAGSPSIFQCELAHYLAEPLKPHPPRKHRKNLYSKYFTTSSSAAPAKNGKIKKRGKWTDPNSPKEKDKLWSLWEPRQATPESSSSGLSTPTAQKGRKDGVIIDRVPRLPGPSPLDNDEDDHTSELSITPTTEAKTPNLLPSPFSNKSTKKEKKAKPSSTSSSFFFGRGKGEYPSSFSSSSSSSSSSSDKPKTKSKGKGKEKETGSGIDSYDMINDESSGSSGLSVSSGSNRSSASSQSSTGSVPTPRPRNFLRFRNFLAAGKGSGK